MADESNTPEMPPRRHARPRPARRWLRRGLLLLGPVIALAAGAYYYATSGRYVTTENAYVKSDKVLVSADIAGRVVEVAVRENEPVEAGDLLFRIDPAPLRLRVARADARLGNLAYEIDALRAAYRQKQAELKIAQQNAAFLRREHGRQQKLAKRGVVSTARLDAARHELQTAENRITAIRADMARVLASLGGDPGLPIEAHPRYLEAMALRDQAMLDLADTEIRAPVRGIPSKVELQVGEFVQAGTPVFSVLSTEPAWIEANLKETDLTNLRAGQLAIVRVDAYPDFEWRATVSSLSPATGAEFALLPPQNATGNWVKVVQRVPVRLRLEDDRDAPPLRAGMSVFVEIDTGAERPMPGIVRSALAWARDRE